MSDVRTVTADFERPDRDGAAASPRFLLLRRPFLLCRLGALLFFRTGGFGDLGMVGAIAAEVMAEAIVRAAETAETLYGVPAMRDRH